MNYSCDVFGFLNVIDTLNGRDYRELTNLGELYSRSVETTEFETLHEVAVSGEVYRVKTIKDYKMNESFHIVSLDGTTIESQEDEACIIVALVDLPEDGTYKKVLDIINSSDDTTDIREIVAEGSSVGRYLVDILLEEYSRKCDFLLELVNEEEDLLSLIRKYSRFEVEEDVLSYILRSVDSQASIVESSILEGTEFCIQEPFSGVAGIVNKRSKDVRLLSDSITPTDLVWSTVTARSLWKTAGEPENRAKAEVEIAKELTLRGLDALQTSLALRGVTPEGGKLRGLKRWWTIRRLRRNLS